MRFTLTIDCDNAAFGDDSLERSRQVTMLLDETVGRMEAGNIGGPIRDANGNTVGRFGFDDGEGV